MKAEARIPAPARWAGIRPACLAIVLLLLLPASGRAQDAQAPAPETGLPSEVDQEILIKTSLLTFNDANATGIYGVFHARLAQPFREQFTSERLKEVFKAFADNRILIGAIAAAEPVMSEAPKIDERGVLLLHGYFDLTGTRRVSFVLDYLISEGDWKLIKIYVDVGKPKAN